MSALMLSLIKYNTASFKLWNSNLTSINSLLRQWPSACLTLSEYFTHEDCSDTMNTIRSNNHHKTLHYSVLYSCHRYWLLFFFPDKEQIMPLFSKCNIMLVGWLPRKNRPPSERQALCIFISVNTVTEYT